MGHCECVAHGRDVKSQTGPRLLLMNISSISSVARSWIAAMSKEPCTRENDVHGLSDSARRAVFLMGGYLCGTLR